ncbi:unnamed protein product [Allacma fusca]|uniref:Uncharacterized protein n=1 Tax=Allacma fusca TaxID=39272 RepID=A0A8J2Q1I0_9HEXA|nr:unnamed protein product [Allacma fusca]
MLCLLAKLAFIVIRETWLMASHVFWTEPFDSFEQHCLEVCEYENAAISANCSDESRHFVDRSCNSSLSFCQEQQRDHKCCHTECKKVLKSCENPLSTATAKSSVQTSTSPHDQLSKSTETNSIYKRSDGSQTSNLDKSKKTNTTISSKSIASTSSQSPLTRVDNGSQSITNIKEHKASSCRIDSTTGTNPVVENSKIAEECVSSARMTPATKYSRYEGKNRPPQTGTTSIQRRSSDIKQSAVLDEDDFLKQVASELGRDPKTLNKISESHSGTFVTCQNSPVLLEGQKSHTEYSKKTTVVSSLSGVCLEKQWPPDMELPEKYKFWFWAVIYTLIFIFLLLHLVFICYHHCSLQNIRDSFQEGKEVLKPETSSGLVKTGSQISCQNNACKHRMYDCSWCPRSRVHQEESSNYIVA